MGKLTCPPVEKLIKGDGLILFYEWAKTIYAFGEVEKFKEFVRINKWWYDHLPNEAKNNLIYCVEIEKRRRKMQNKLYEITADVKALDELYLEAIDEETGELKEGATLEEFEKELKTALQEKGKNIVGFILDSGLMIENIDNEIKRLQALKKRGQNKLENFKNYVSLNMQAMNINKIETPLGTMSLRKSKAVKVDESRLDMTDTRYIKEKVTYTVSKTDLKALLEKGEIIQGASLVTNQSLQIR